MYKLFILLFSLGVLFYGYSSPYADKEWRVIVGDKHKVKLNKIRIYDKFYEWYKKEFSRKQRGAGPRICSDCSKIRGINKVYGRIKWKDGYKLDYMIMINIKDEEYFLTLKPIQLANFKAGVLYSSQDLNDATDKIKKKIKGSLLDELKRIDSLLLKYLEN